MDYMIFIFSTRLLWTMYSSFLNSCTWWNQFVSEWSKYLQKSWTNQMLLHFTVIQCADEVSLGSSAVSASPCPGSAVWKPMSPGGKVWGSRWAGVQSQTGFPGLSQWSPSYREIKTDSSVSQKSCINSLVSLPPLDLKLLALPVATVTCLKQHVVNSSVDLTKNAIEDEASNAIWWKVIDKIRPKKKKGPVQHKCHHLN